MSPFIGLERPELLWQIVAETRANKRRKQRALKPVYDDDYRAFIIIIKKKKMDGCDSPAIHPAIAPLSFLLGKWRGQGQGGFPTINSFSYAEELHFSHSGKPVIGYAQKTWKLGSGEPMHAESGYWRPKPDGTIEVVIAQSTGLVEVQKGTYDAEAKAIKLQSELVGNASKVKEITRVFELKDGELSYVVQMATNLTKLEPHLKALLKKM